MLLINKGSLKIVSTERLRWVLLFYVFFLQSLGVKQRYAFLCTAAEISLTTTLSKQVSARSVFSEIIKLKFKVSFKVHFLNKYLQFHKGSIIVYFLLRKRVE